MHSPSGQSPSPYAWLLPLMTLGLALGVVAGLEAEAWQLPAAATALSLMAALLLPGKRRIAALMMAAASLGALLTYHANHPVLPEEGTYTVTAVVLDELRLAEAEDDHLHTTLGDITLNGEPFSGRAFWSAYASPDEPFPDWLRPGVRLTFTADVYHPGGASNPGGYDFRLSLLSGGVTLGVYGLKDAALCDEPAGLAGQLAALRHRLTLDLQRIMGEEEGGMAAAMLLGTKDYLSNEDYAAFKRLGISHILSVSGYHVGVLAMMLSALLGPLQLHRKLRLTLLSVLLFLYALLTGAAPPVIRAGLLVFLREIGMLSRRRNAPLHLLCLAAACQLLMNPLQLFGASFQLTYSAMLGLILIYPRLRRKPVGAPERTTGFRDGFMASLAVQLGLLPAQLYWFGGFPLASLVLNVFVIALSSGVMLLYWLTLAVLPIPFVAEAVGAVTGALTHVIQLGIRFLASVLGYSLWVPAPNWLTLAGWAMVMLGLSVLIHRSRELPRRILAITGALLMAVSMFRLPNTQTYWIQFSDGEADGALLHDREAVVLVDAGENAYTIAGYLYDHRLSVDTLILTHLHEDHAGGIEGLLELEIPVRRCCIPEGAELAGNIDPIVTDLLARLAATGTEIVHVSRGDVIATPNAQLTVLWPQSGALRPGQDANDTCMVLQADILGTTMLLTADLTSRYEMYTAIPADILKAAHHGSGESTAPEFLVAVDPQVILLSCGTEEREAGFLPRAGGIPVCSTHTSGAITIRFTGGSFTVEPFLPR